MKVIRNIIITLVVIVAILGVVIIGGYVYVRTTYGIDLFRTAEQLKSMIKSTGLSSMKRTKATTAIRSTLLHLRAKV